MNASAVLGLSAALGTIATPAAAQNWRPGQIVLGSPTTIEAGFLRCEVVRGPEANNYYVMNCLKSYVDHNGNKKRYEAVSRVSGNWIKPDNSSYQPDMQFALVRANASAPTRTSAQPAAPPSPSGGSASAGSYHCVLFVNGILQTVPGFTLTGAAYRHQNGGGGTVRRSGNTIEFVGGPLNGQAGKVGNQTINIYNESRSRTVIDCNTKR